MANVKVPALLHKMSKAAQKAWYKKNNMTMPSEVEGGGRSAAAAKRVVAPAPRKQMAAAPQSVRAMNTARQQAYYAKGGRQPIGAGGSGGSSSMAGSNMSTAKGIVAGIKAGFNPKVSLNPYEGMTAKEKKSMKKEEVEQIEEGNPANKAKKKEAIRQLGLKAMKAGKVDPARGYIPQRAGREQLKKEETKMNEVTKKEAEETLGGPVKTKPKMPPGKQPAGYRYVRGLARKAMKAGMKKDEYDSPARKAMERELQYNPKYRMEEVEQVGEARRMSAAEKLGRAFDSEQQRSALSRQRGLDLLKQKDTEKMQNKPASGNMTKIKKEETEESTMKYIEEKLTAADPASKWISDFVKSDNPKFAGKSKKERIQQALGAYYAKKRGTNEEVELDESHGAEKLGDMLESDADHETKMKRIKIAPTAHLKYLHKYNMGYSGGGDHPMIKHIKDELKNRKMKNEETEQMDEGNLSIRALYNKYADHYTSSEGNSAKRADAVEKTITKVHGPEVMNHLKKAVKANLRNDMDQEENHFERARNAAEKSGSDRVNATVGKNRSKFRKEEVEQIDVELDEAVEQLDEGPSHIVFSGSVNDKDFEITAPMHKLDSLSDPHYRREVLERDNDHLEPHEIEAIVDSAGEDEYHATVMHNGKKITHHVINHDEPHYMWEEVEQIDELKKSTLASYVGKAAGRLAAASRLQRDFEKDGHTALAGEFEKSAQKKKVGIQKAANKLAKEEAEQIDEAIRGYITHKPAGLKGLRTADRSVEIRRPADQAERDTLAKNLAANRKYNLGKIGRKSGHVRKNAAGTTYGQKTSIAVGSPAGSKELGPKKFRYAEEVEQTDEAIRGYIRKGGDNAYLGVQVRRPANQAERDKLAQDIAANRKYNAGKNIGRKSGNVRANAAGMTQSQKNAVTAFSTASNKELGPKRYSYESVEGKVAVTPKEKSLAAHHGDKTKITFGDVLKARLKSAAAKKMGK
jgi:hypothetical protein